MIDIRKTYKTRDGRPVELLTTTARGKWPVCGYIGDSEDLFRWSLDGTIYSYSRLNAFDLVEVKPKRVLWLNVYPDGISVVHDSREDADGRRFDGCIACLKIEFEEGRFDE